MQRESYELGNGFILPTILSRSFLYLIPDYREDHLAKHSQDYQHQRQILASAIAQSDSGDLL